MKIENTLVGDGGAGDGCMFSLSSAAECLYTAGLGQGVESTGRTDSSSTSLYANGYPSCWCFSYIGLSLSLFLLMAWYS
jgi:hypothetical protein